MTCRIAAAAETWLTMSDLRSRIADVVQQTPLFNAYNRPTALAVADAVIRELRLDFDLRTRIANEPPEVVSGP